MIKNIKLETFGGESITADVVFGENKGNSTNITIIFDSASLKDEKKVIIEILGASEREALGELFLELGNVLTHKSKNNKLIGEFSSKNVDWMELKGDKYDETLMEIKKLKPFFVDRAIPMASDLYVVNGVIIAYEYPNNGDDYEEELYALINK